MKAQGATQGESWAKSKGDHWVGVHLGKIEEANESQEHQGGPPGSSPLRKDGSRGG